MTKVQRVEREKVVDYYNEDDEEAVDVQEEKVDIKEIKKIDFSVPPHDDYLVKHTLWPEMNKLYGHPHELECICRSPDSKFMATSCKALTKETASIIIWST
jgi:elongator complex protein 2